MHGYFRLKRQSKTTTKGNFVLSRPHFLSSTPNYKVSRSFSFQSEKMVGDFMVCVDRIIASASCFESNNGVGDGFVRKAEEIEKEGSSESKKKYNNGESLKKKNIKNRKGESLIECRICQEEGDESEMETPCACNGTLKFAHRKCIQNWCNKKGDITCEICNQVYEPNYSAPPARTSSDVIAIDIRQGWGLHDSHFLAIAAAEQELLNAEYEDYAAAHNSGIACCRSVALVLMLLLLVRHMLMVIWDAGMVQDAIDFFNLSLQFAGFLLPCYLIVYKVGREDRSNINEF